MSVFLPICRQNTRRSAGLCTSASRPLAHDRARSKDVRIRVRQGFQSFPAIHRYPLTTGRLCVSPSHPPTLFSRVCSHIAPHNCRSLASPCSHLRKTRVPLRQDRVIFNCIRLLPKGAHNASRTNDLHGYDLCGLRNAVSLCPRGHHVACGPLDDWHIDAVEPLPLTNLLRLPAPSVPRGRIVMPDPVQTGPDKKDSPCSTRS